MDYLNLGLFKFYSTISVAFKQNWLFCKKLNKIHSS